MKLFVLLQKIDAFVPNVYKTTLNNGWHFGNDPQVRYCAFV